MGDTHDGAVPKLLQLLHSAGERKITTTRAQRRRCEHFSVENYVKLHEIARNTTHFREKVILGVWGRGKVSQTVHTGQ